MELTEMEIQQVKDWLVSGEGRYRMSNHEEWAIPPVPHGFFAYAQGPLFPDFPKRREDIALFTRRVWDCFGTGLGYDELFVAWKDRDGFHCRKFEDPTPEGYFDIGDITVDESGTAVGIKPL